MRNAFQFEQRRSERAAARPWIHLLERPADHVEHEPAGVDVRRAMHGHERAVSQYGDAVGQLEDLVHAMRHVQNGDPLLSQTSQMREESPHFRLAEAGRRLVENEEPGPPRDGARDADFLLLGRGQLLDHAVGFDGDAELRQATTGLGMQGPPIDTAPSSPGPALAEHQVLGNRQVRKALQLLLHGRDASSQRVARGSERDRCSVQTDGSRVGRLDAAEQLDQRRLARSVLADEPQDLACLERQVDALERGHAGE